MYLNKNSFKAPNLKAGSSPAFPESFFFNTGESKKEITLILKLTMLIIGLEPITLEIYFELETS